MLVALTDGARRHAANDLPWRDWFNDDGPCCSNAAFAKTGAIQHGNIGTQPYAVTDIASFACPDALLGDRNIGSVGLIVASAYEIAPWPQYGIVADSHWTVLSRLDNRVGADTGAVSYRHGAFLAGDHRIVGKDDFVADLDRSRLSGMPRVKQDAFA